MEEINLYPKITKFLVSRGFIIKFINSTKIVIDFAGDEIENAYKEFRKLQTKGDLVQNAIDSNKLYEESWEVLNTVEKKYYPKLQPILELLNSFYKKNETPLEFILVFENSEIRNFYLSFNNLFYKMYPDKELFLKNIEKEFQNLNKFVENFEG